MYVYIYILYITIYIYNYIYTYLCVCAIAESDLQDHQWPSPGGHAVPPASKASPPGCWTNSCPAKRKPNPRANRTAGCFEHGKVLV